jgi:hypothetical protein
LVARGRPARLFAPLLLLSAALWAFPALAGQKTGADTPRSPAQAEEGEDLRGDALPWLDQLPAVVSLKGFVVSKRYYGPPGHGENPAEDRKVSGWLLLLNVPVNIRADPEDKMSYEEKNVRQVQLVVIGRERRHLFKKLDKVLGQEVYATGMLYQTQSGWYWTLTGLELLDISLVPRDTGRAAE